MAALKKAAIDSGIVLSPEWGTAGKPDFATVFDN